MRTFENVLDALEHWASVEESRVAYRFLRDGELDEQSLCYGQLLEQAQRIAGALSTFSNAGDRIVVMMPAGLEFIPVFWGCLWSGLVPCVAYPAQPGSGAQGVAAIAAMHRDASAAFVVTSRVTRAALLDSSAWRAAGMPTPLAAEDLLAEGKAGPRRASALAYLQYTSGSTSSPKAVRITHRSLPAQCRQMQRAYDFTQETVSMYWLPMDHAFGLVAGIIIPAYLGHLGVLMAPAHFLGRPLRWLEAISRHRAYMSGASNFAYDLVCSALVRGEQPRHALDLSCWRVAGMGGEAIQVGTLDRMRAELGKFGFPATTPKPAYGLSEATLAVCGGPQDVPVRAVALDSDALARGLVLPVGPDDREGARYAVDLGQIHHNVEVEVIDTATGRPALPNQVGEIWVRGPNVADGYWQRPEETSAVFGGRIDGSDERYLRTGDMGFVYDGSLFITGRRKELIIVRGLKYFPPDIEATVRTAAAELSGAPVAAFPWSGPHGEGLGIAVELANPEAGAIDRIRDAVALRHGVECSHIALCAPGTLPRTGSGKLRRLTISELAARGELTLSALGEGAGPGHSPAALRERITACWQDLLGVEQVGLDDNFFDLAGQSLLAVRLIARINAELKVDLRFAELFEHPTVRELAELIGQRHTVLEQRIVPTPKCDFYALTPTQDAFYMLEQVGRSVWYNCASCVAIEGPLDLALLEVALNSVIERHEATRGTFCWVDGAPQQRFNETIPFRLEHVDLTDHDERSAAVCAQVRQLATTHFELVGPCLIRAAAIRLAPDKHLLVTVMAHIISDGWSVSVLWRDLFEIYRARVEGGAPRLEPMAFQYRDFVHWQRELRSPDALVAHQRYWHDKLGDEIPVLQLPTAYPRPPLKGDGGDSEFVTLDGARLQHLQQLCRATRSTPFAVVVAVIKVVLRAHSGQRDIIVGTPMAGRALSEQEGQVGNYINIVPLRDRVDDDQAFDSVLRNVRQTIVEAHEHQLYSLADLLSDVDVLPDLSRNPLFDVLVSYHNYYKLFGATRSVAGLTVRPVYFAAGVSRFDLSFDFYEHENAIILEVQYASDLFLRTAVRKFATELCVLLEAVAHRPQARIADLLRLLVEPPLEPVGPSSIRA